MDARPNDLRAALRISLASVLWSGTVGLAAVVVALASGSLSMLGFGVDATIDGAASAVLIWRFAIEVRQPDRAARVERLATSIVGITLIVFAAYLALAAVRSISAGNGPESSLAAEVLLVASVIVLPPLAMLKHRVAVRLGSRALRADSVFTGVGAILAGLSLVSLAAAALAGLWWTDALAALIAAAILLREGISAATDR